MSVRGEANQGYSSYEIAAQHGYTGTEAQWNAATQTLPTSYVKKAELVDDGLDLMNQSNVITTFDGRIPVGGFVMARVDNLSFDYGTWRCDYVGQIITGYSGRLYFYVRLS